jgi:hypothetical protein
MPFQSTVNSLTFGGGETFLKNGLEYHAVQQAERSKDPFYTAPTGAAGRRQFYDDIKASTPGGIFRTGLGPFKAQLEGLQVIDPTKWYGEPANVTLRSTGSVGIDLAQNRFADAIKRPTWKNPLTPMGAGAGTLGYWGVIGVGNYGIEQILGKERAQDYTDPVNNALQFGKYTAADVFGGFTSSLGSSWQKTGRLPSLGTLGGNAWKAGLGSVVQNGGTALLTNGLARVIAPGNDKKSQEMRQEIANTCGDDNNMAVGVAKQIACNTDLGGGPPIGPAGTPGAVNTPPSGSGTPPLLLAGYPYGQLTFPKTDPELLDALRPDGVPGVFSFNSSPAFDSVGPAIVGPATVGPAIVGPKTVGPGIVGPATVGPAIVGPKTVGPGIVGPAIVGPAIVGPKTVGPGIVGPATVGPAIVGPKTVGPGIVGPATVGPAIVGPKTVGPAIVGPKPSLADRGAQWWNDYSAWAREQSRTTILGSQALDGTLGFGVTRYQVRFVDGGSGKYDPEGNLLSVDSGTPPQKVPGWQLFAPLEGGKGMIPGAVRGPGSVPLRVPAIP